ncbi:hypothetical protein [Streptomyces anulatus]|uniref:hypothetical protein n=1 Tax=Streptomyces anulatus TaxID=1892 RepID=UPI0036316544
MEDPSEDALFMLFDNLNGSDRTFGVIRPDQDDPAWSASVTFLGKGGYEVVRRATTRREHEVVTGASIDRIARDLTIWMAARDFPERAAPGER